jgi:hypothetical protein
MKSDPIDRRISELETELHKLRQRKISQLREELAQLESGFTGERPSARAAKGWAAELTGDPASTGKRSYTRKTSGSGKRLTDEDVVNRLRKVVAAAGSEGISARAAAIQSGVFYVRAIKAMNDNFVKSGAGKWTRYTI